jgi:hypothetical protein
MVKAIAALLAIGFIAFHASGSNANPPGYTCPNPMQGAAADRCVAEEKCESRGPNSPGCVAQCAAQYGCKQ